MSSYQRWVTVTSSALWITLTITVWVGFAPMQVGGQTAFVIVNGNSMEPNFHLGDLIIIRPEPYYSIGDQVVYQNSDLGGSVFHRIIDLELDKSAVKDRPLDGYIGFQDEAKRVWYRNVRIKELK